MPDDLAIERTIDLDIDADELWRLVSTSEGWADWMVDAGDVDVVPGGTGCVTEGDVVRFVEVVEVDEGTGLRFRWWEPDDPASASEVQIEISPGNGGQRIVVTERLERSSSRAAAYLAWDVRACSLWACAGVLIPA